MLTRFVNRLFGVVLAMLCILTITDTAHGSPSLADEVPDISNFLNIYLIPPTSPHQFTVATNSPVVYNVSLHDSYVPLLVNGTADAACLKPVVNKLSNARELALPDSATTATLLVTVSEAFPWMTANIKRVEVAIKAAGFVPSAELMDARVGRVAVNSLLPTAHSLVDSTEGLLVTVLYGSNLASDSITHSMNYHANDDDDDSLLVFAATTLHARIYSPFGLPLAKDLVLSLFIPKLASAAPASAMPAPLSGFAVTFSPSPVLADDFNVIDAYNAGDTDISKDDTGSAAQKLLKFLVTNGVAAASFEPALTITTSLTTSPVLSAIANDASAADLVPSPMNDASSMINTMPVARTSRVGTKERFQLQVKQQNQQLTTADTDSDLSSSNESVEVHIDVRVPYYMNEPIVTFTHTDNLNNDNGVNLVTRSTIAGSESRGDRHYTATVTVSRGPTVGTPVADLPGVLTLDICGNGFVTAPGYTYSNTDESDSDSREIVFAPVTLTLTPMTPSPASAYRPATVTYVKACDRQAAMSPALVAAVVVAIIVLVLAVAAAVWHFFRVIHRGRTFPGAEGDLEAEAEWDRARLRAQHRRGLAHGDDDALATRSALALNDSAASSDRASQSYAQRMPFLSLICPCLGGIFATVNSAGAGEKKRKNRRVAGVASCGSGEGGVTGYLNSDDDEDDEYDYHENVVIGNDDDDEDIEEGLGNSSSFSKGFADGTRLTVLQHSTSSNNSNDNSASVTVATPSSAIPINIQSNNNHGDENSASSKPRSTSKGRSLSKGRSASKGLFMPPEPGSGVTVSTNPTRTARSPIAQIENIDDLIADAKAKAAAEEAAAKANAFTASDTTAAAAAETVGAGATLGDGASASASAGAGEVISVRGGGAQRARGSTVDVNNGAAVSNTASAHNGDMRVPLESATLASSSSSISTSKTATAGAGETTDGGDDPRSVVVIRGGRKSRSTISAAPSSGAATAGGHSAGNGAAVSSLHAVASGKYQYAHATTGRESEVAAIPNIPRTDAAQMMARLQGNPEAAAAAAAAAANGKGKKNKGGNETELTRR